MLRDYLVGLQHIGIPVSNIIRSKHFYEELGFVTIAYKENLDHYHVAMMQLGDCVIELYESLEEGKNDVFIRKDGHIDHLALECSDIEKVYKMCVALGYNIISNGIESTKIWGEEGKYFIFTGPDDERIEFAYKG